MTRDQEWTFIRAHLADSMVLAVTAESFEGIPRAASALVESDIREQLRGKLRQILASLERMSEADS